MDQNLGEFLATGGFFLLSSKKFPHGGILDQPLSNSFFTVEMDRIWIEVNSTLTSDWMLTQLWNLLIQVIKNILQRLLVAMYI